MLESIENEEKSYEFEVKEIYSDQDIVCSRVSAAKDSTPSHAG